MNPIHQWRLFGYLSTKSQHHEVPLQIQAQEEKSTPKDGSTITIRAVEIPPAEFIDQGLKDKLCASQKQNSTGVIENCPPQDRGKAAWCFLAAASVVLQVSWGFAESFGVFREYYFKNPPFEGVHSIAEVGVLSGGLIYLLSPFLVHYLSGRPQKRKPMMWAGMVICTVSYIGAAFARTPAQLIMTQGALHGTGSGLLFTPSMSLLDEWFMQRRCLANGIYYGACSLAAAVLPPILSAMFEKYKQRTTMISWSVFSGTVTIVCLVIIQPRLRVTGGSKISRKSPLSGDISYGFFTKPIFWLVLVSNGLQACAQSLPSVYLPSYATDLHITVNRASLLLTYSNLAGLIVLPFLGILLDKRGVLIPLLLCSFVPSSAVLLGWGFSRTYWSLAIVSIVFGSLSSGYPVLRPRFATAVVGNDDHPNQELIVSGIINLIRGLAFVSSGVIGSAAVSLGEDTGIKPGYGAGKWAPLILTTGILFALSGIGAAGFLRAKRQKVNDKEGFLKISE